MRIRMKRLIATDNATVGMLTYNGITFGTCEDEHREEKVANETRIPAGTYDIIMRTDSPMVKRYKQKLGGGYAGMPWLQDVPGFTYVYIHIGNTEKDTSGCILVGNSVNFVGMSVLASTKAYRVLHRSIRSALDAGEKVSITIEDEDNG